ncbi:hypothetical protein ACOMHN_005551 [Nucella lapillus]
MNVTYNSEERQLHIVCPPAEQGTLEATYVYRNKPSGERTDLANWSSGKVKNSYERTQASKLPGQGLVVQLSHVTCFDSVVYTCKNVITPIPIARTVYVDYNCSFTYMGEVTRPYLTAPIRARFEPGEELELNCSANVGSMENGIVWSLKREGEASQDHLAETAQHVRRILGEESIGPDCSLRRSSQLRYVLAPEDDGAIFECRLSNSGHNSRFIVTVAARCPDNHVTAAQDGAVSALTGPSPTGSLLQLVDSPKAEEVRDEDGGATGVKGGKADGTALIIVISAIAVILLLAFATMILVMRRWRQRQMRPLVVVDTPASSEYGYGDRRLPHLSNLSMLDHHRSHHHHLYPYPYPHDLSAPSSALLSDSLPSTTRFSSLATSRYVGSPLSTCRSCPEEEDDSNVSVYVSMTGLSYSHPGTTTTTTTTKVPPFKGDGLGLGPTPAAQPLKSSDPASVVSGDPENDLGPDMREERSESIYSNQARNDSNRGRGNTNHNNNNNNNNNNNRNNSSVRNDVGLPDEVTRLKIVD